jgi:hypothetical protein
VLHREERRHLVVLEDDPAAGVEDEPHVEVAVLPVGVPRLRLRHDEHVVLARDLSELFGLLPRDVDRAFPGEGRVVEIQHLVVERLERPLGEGDQPDGNREARQPRGRLDQVVEMLKVDLDVGALPDAPHRGYEPDCHVRLDHLPPHTRCG